MIKTNNQNQVSKGLELPVMEHFYTIQGEGANSGKPAYFVRLGGCDVGCTWCDVKESWSFDAHPKYSIETILNWVLVSKAPNVVITGGEPSLYNLQPLTSAFKKHKINLKTKNKINSLYIFSTKEINKISHANICVYIDAERPKEFEFCN